MYYTSLTNLHTDALWLYQIRQSHSLRADLESEPDWEYQIAGETAVSPEQIGTDRINVNENFMVCHHAILMSRPVSALAWPQMRPVMMEMSPPDTDIMWHTPSDHHHTIIQAGDGQCTLLPASCCCHWTQFYQRVTNFVNFRLLFIVTSINALVSNECI